MAPPHAKGGERQNRGGQDSAVPAAEGGQNRSVGTDQGKVGELDRLVLELSLAHEHGHTALRVVLEETNDPGQPVFDIRGAEAQSQPHVVDEGSRLDDNILAGEDQDRASLFVQGRTCIEGNG